MSKKIISLLTSAAIGLAAAGPLQADLFATAYSSLSNFQFLDSDGNLLDADTDFGSIAFTSSADMDGTLSGTLGFNGGLQYSEPNGGNIDFPTSCLSTTGDCPVLGNNTQPPVLLTGPQSTDFVTGDQYQFGAPIANLDNEIDGTGDFTTGADILSITTANLSATTAAGSANANNGLEGNWTFTLLGEGVITVAADNLSTYLEAFASTGEIFPGKASADIDWNLTITDIGGADGFGVIFDANADILGFDTFSQTTSANANDFAFDVQTCGTFAGLGAPCGVGFSAPISFDTPFLTAGNLYQISVRTNANIDIARVAVPEPGILALLGMGLMGMFLTRRKG